MAAKMAAKIRYIDDGVLTFRDQLDYTCKERGDGWSSEISLRLSGVSGDLHASAAQYHAHCYSKFRKTATDMSRQPYKRRQHERDQDQHMDDQ